MRVSLLKLRIMIFGNQLISSPPPSEGDKGGGLLSPLKFLILCYLIFLNVLVNFKNINKSNFSRKNRNLEI